MVIAGTVTTTKRLVLGGSAFGGARFKENGKLDRSFANNGKATWTAGDKTDHEPWLLRTGAGNLLLGGGSQRGGGGTPHGCVIPLTSIYGQAGPGYCAVPPGMSYAGFQDATPDRTGGAVVAVHGLSRARNVVFGVGRVDGNGNLDTAFGNGGYSLTEFGRWPGSGVDMGASNVAPRLDGYIAGGAAPTALGFVGFTAAGQLDPAFGQGGKLALDPDPTNDPIVLSRLVSLGGGRTLAVCFTFAERSGKPTRGILVVIRANGTLDPSFGNRGKVVLTGSKLGIETIDSLYSAVRQPDGKIIVLGSAYRSLDDNIGLLMFRLTPNGKLDRGFGR